MLVDEVLWWAGLDPRRPARSLTADEVADLHRAIRRRLPVMLRRGGSHTGTLSPDVRAAGGTVPARRHAARRARRRRPHDHLVSGSPALNLARSGGRACCSAPPRLDRLDDVRARRAPRRARPGDDRRRRVARAGDADRRPGARPAGGDGRPPLRPPRRRGAGRARSPRPAPTAPSARPRWSRSTTTSRAEPVEPVGRLSPCRRRRAGDVAEPERRRASAAVAGRVTTAEPAETGATATPSSGESSRTATDDDAEANARRRLPQSS